MDRICASCSKLRQFSVLFTFLFIAVYGSANDEFSGKEKLNLEKNVHDVNGRDLRGFTTMGHVRSKDNSVWKNIDDNLGTSVYDQPVHSQFENSDMVDEIVIPREDGHLHTINREMSTIDRAIAQLEEDLAENNNNKNFDNNRENVDRDEIMDKPTDGEETELKKRPAFASWAGKRARFTKRQFTVWGGKRSQAQTEKEKRPAFHSWSGKRSVMDESYSGPNWDAETGGLIKRPAFHSWSGKKRSVADDEDVQKRPWFRSWKGKKRSSDDFTEDDNSYDFNDRAGDGATKMSPYMIPLYYQNYYEDGNLVKRPAFHAWSGKRSPVSDIENQSVASHIQELSDLKNLLSDLPNDVSNDESVAKRPAFASWAGKRSYDNFSPTENERSSQISDFTENEKRPSFHAWSGKRAQENDNPIHTKDDNNAFLSSDSLLASKRPAFHSWGGKRFVDNPKRSDDSAASFLRALTKSLLDIKYGNENLGSLMASVQGRQHILIALKSLYNLLVNRRHHAEDALLADSNVASKPNSYALVPRSKPSAFIKRPAFHSWGGKRSFQENQNPYAKTSSRFWALKRSVSVDQQYPLILSRRKRSVDSTQSLQSADLKDNPEKQTEVANSLKSTNKVKLARNDGIILDKELQKKAAFHSWSGKRSNIGFSQDQKNQDNIKTHNVPNLSQNGLNEDIDNSKTDDVSNVSIDLINRNQIDPENIEKRPAFHSWGGKRNIANDTENIVSNEDGKEFVALQEVKNSPKNIKSNQLSPETGALSYNTVKRPAFHSWSGKRNFHSDQVEGATEKNVQDSHENKRPAFNSWLGKRSEAADDLTLDGVSPAKRPAFHSWSGKRSQSDITSLAKRPSFHSWSGKRSDSVDTYTNIEEGFGSFKGKISDSEDIDNVKRPSFHSWSGKRSDLEDIETYKRPSFHSWSGKRSDSENMDTEKRPSFHSWSGKRSDLEATGDDKRPSFHSWSGKRSVSEDIDTDKRPAFHSWSGKRSDLEDIDNDKRPSFHSWSGKRSDSEETVPGKRPSFHSWSGKRSDLDNTETGKRGAFHSWSGKRSDLDNTETGKRAAFHSWSGKRSDLDENDDLQKRPAFYSWSGKRTHPWYGNLWSPDNFSFNSDNEQRESSNIEKRPAFHSWSGKREFSGPFEENRDEIFLADKRPSFHSWSGKRAADGNNFLPVESEDDEYNGIITGSLTPNKRPAFTAWSGKRDWASAATDSSNKIPDLYNWPFGIGELPVFKRPAFHSWLGKRQEPDTSGEELKTLGEKENIENVNSKSTPNSSSDLNIWSPIHDNGDTVQIQQTQYNSPKSEPISDSSSSTNHVLTKRFAIAKENGAGVTDYDYNQPNMVSNSNTMKRTPRHVQRGEPVVLFQPSPLGTFLIKRNNQRHALGRLIQKAMRVQPYTRRRKFYSWAGKRSSGHNSQIQIFRTLS